MSWMGPRTEGVGVHAAGDGVGLVGPAGAHREGPLRVGHTSGVRHRGAAACPVAAPSTTDFPPCLAALAGLAPGNHLGPDRATLDIA
ncbi:hypothetical protein SNA_25245 [Streptomyces natalensis ATCC 27448]|uniref:Uncharacterized protein n=1 Tax=Streptomyces natalensis ATCC 27448 TaxID=1240678 RepID=A0A0D7CHX4_9ACTN|nr:hypothetical protein SNA_25245 [Streptomyces natalensis ATCC 27448]